MYDIDHLNDRDDLAMSALKGAAAGIVGTAALTLGMHYAPQLMQKLGVMPQQPDGGGNREEPPAKLAEMVAETALDTSLDEGTKETAGQAIHWGYGAAWGAVYGMAQHELRLPHLLHGAVFGGLVAGVASTVVPAMNLTPPPTEQPMEQNAMQMGLHLLYGEVTALVYDALSS